MTHWLSAKAVVLTTGGAEKAASSRQGTTS